MFNYTKHTEERTQQISDYMRDHGQLVWRKGWDDPDASPGILSASWNPTTGKSYKGMNAFALTAQRVLSGYDDSRWMTYRQALTVGGQLRKGERSTTIVFWDFSKMRGRQTQLPKGEDAEDDRASTRPIPRPAHVFNAAQIDGLPPAPTLIVPESVRNIRFRELLDKHKPKLYHDGGNKAFYIPATDSIHVPKFQAFENPTNYMATVMHELAHWTSAGHRLDRELGARGTEAYAREELIAEMSSVLLQDRCGIGLGKEHFENHAAYLQHWQKILAQDSKALFKAAAQAEKVVTWLGVPEYDYPLLPMVKKEQEAERGPAPSDVCSGKRMAKGRKKEREMA